MTLEQQVTSLEISKRLKELGVRQESLFWWVKRPVMNQTLIKEWQVVFDYYHDESKISAFTVAELGEILPSDIVSGRTPDSIARGWDNWECMDFIEFGAAAYHHDDSKIKKSKFIADSEANARGLMLIYLLENKLITL